jgi:excisionase family DNA binding protein
MPSARPEPTGRKLRGHSHDQTDRLVYTVPEAGRLLGLSRNASYEAAKRGEIPTLRIGRLLLVPKGPFHRMVELITPSTAVPAKKSDSDTEPAEEVAKL